MAPVTNRYELGPGKQLLDLNGDSTNFEVSFTVQCAQATPYEAVVVDQYTLDTAETLDYKSAVDGYISGNMVVDKDVYQNYYLCMRSTTHRCVVDVSIEKRDITDDEMRQRQQQRQAAEAHDGAPMEPGASSGSHEGYTGEPSPDTNAQAPSPWGYAAGAVIVAIVALVTYALWSRKGANHSGIYARTSGYRPGINGFASRLAALQ